MSEELLAGEWNSRRYMPHFDGENLIQHITFHLADSMSAKALQAVDQIIATVPEDQRARERRTRIEALVDSGFGSCILREPDVARMVQDSLLHFDGARYRVMEWVIMPNHVHLLVQPMRPWKVGSIVASWKKWTARKICDHLGANRIDNGPIWHREYWDRYIRDEKHLASAVEYIHYNPVKARLAGKPELWPWGSAALRSRGESN
ncbi:transposase [soil metagenome]